MNKEALKIAIEQSLRSKAQHLESIIEGMRSSNSETKSSMGDKYETGREMLQQEINGVQQQLSQVQQQLDFLLRINTGSSARVGTGSLIKTSHGKFFISVPLGIVDFDGEKIFAISHESPVAKTMMGKAPGDDFIIANASEKIENIW